MSSVATVLRFKRTSPNCDQEGGRKELLVVTRISLMFFRLGTSLGTLREQKREHKRTQYAFVFPSSDVINITQRRLYRISVVRQINATMYQPFCNRCVQNIGRRQNFLWREHTAREDYFSSTINSS